MALTLFFCTSNRPGYTSGLIISFADILYGLRNEKFKTSMTRKIKFTNKDYFAHVRSQLVRFAICYSALV